MIFHSTSAGSLIVSISRSTGLGDDLTSFRMSRRRDVASCNAVGLLGIDSSLKSVFSTIQLGQA